MKIEVCDGPGCNTTRAQFFWADGYCDWITVEANEDTDHGGFCSWTCLAAWAANKAVERDGVLHAVDTEGSA